MLEWKFSQHAPCILSEVRPEANLILLLVRTPRAATPQAFTKILLTFFNRHF
jgi:hypothetical protein